MRDTIEMASEVGFCHDINNGIYLSTPTHIKALVALVRADEREACAKVCYDVGLFHEVSQGSDLAFELAEAIRARGNE
jgi:hypothetical protein